MQSCESHACGECIHCSYELVRSLHACSFQSWHRILGLKFRVCGSGLGFLDLELKV